VPPYKLYEQVKTYYFQRKVPALLETTFGRKDEREKADYIMAMTSLFKKSLIDPMHKFTIILPSGGMVYFFFIDQEEP